ncbi:ATP-dependent rRNA helicase spb4 [Annulohypoxylon maeteangense]|uniref:ATP-dependent rRNA helicase spb4 n=1 Tax=Annulohypoxylon maeteangense TaxID=1927788 RepID=UPI00200813FC|nr:ATP-dependent rRNA helicase spb4 [Annulohypoxylon maeteangense]KAI0884541.1 ATP-dependent rRNA helicase spb4 [Annulohypoxylon maeteangense]
MMAPEATTPKKDPRAWDALTPPLAEWILDAVSSMGFARATPVQASVWPLFGGGNKDVVVEAVTGSGKTLSFLLPLVHRILRQDEPTKRHHVASIVVAPTKELAGQIHGALMSLIAFHPASSELLPFLSGEEKRPETSSPVVVPQLLSGGSTTTTAQDLSFFLRASPNILISTPGRLVELLSSPHVHCPQSSFEVLVLDEADRLLDLGFKADLQKILSRLPKQRRTGLFSASVSEAVGEIIRVGLRNPVKIAVKVKSLKTGGIIEERRTPASLQMSYLSTPASHKLPSLVQLLEKLDPRPQKSIVFLSTCAAVDYFSHILPVLLPEGFDLVPLHGKFDAKVREKNFSKFLTSAQPSVLLTTDVAARGLDFPQVDLVVQIDPPSDPKSFLHRCGRAGRAGRRGLSVIFLQPSEEDYIPFLDVRKTPIAPLPYPRIIIADSEARETAERIREAVRADRALHDKAQKAFVSWVRSYSKHTASSIFRVGDQDWTDLGHAWGLLRLPKMPELKKFTGDKFLGVEMDWDTYAYAKKDRENQRLAALQKYLEEKEAGGDSTEAHHAKKRRNAEAWSGKHEKEDLRSQRRDKKKRKREAERKQGLNEEEKAKERDLESLLEEVRRRNKEKYAAAAAADADAGKGDGGGDEFMGFD